MRGNVYNGQCACGCGMSSNILKYDDPISGRKAGQSKMYVAGHYHIHMKNIGKITGKQYQSKKDRENRRTELVKAILQTDGTKSLQEISKEVAPKHPLESCSLLINNARRWKWVNGGIFYGEIPRITVYKLIQKVEDYERRDIPYERETDLPMITKRHGTINLDAKYGDDDDRTGYSMFYSDTLTPLEILLQKEEIESEEYQARERRINEWNKWVYRRDNSAFKKEIEQLICQ